jgi:UrcA family protein
LPAGINTAYAAFARAAQRSLIGAYRNNIPTTRKPTVTEQPMTTGNTRLLDNWHTSGALTACTACLLVGAFGTTHAATPGAAPAIKVAYSDLNLESVSGTQALYARIVSAARDVCSAREVDIRDLGALARAQACETRAITQAVHDVHSPALAALSTTRVPHG